MEPAQPAFGFMAADDHTAHPGLDDGPGAHLARLQRDVHGAVLQPPVADLFAGLADGIHLRMGQSCSCRYCAGYSLGQ